ncbi:MAG: hypothetical protein GC152_06160 [Alphaproteobacteria bacterium]|nr:hypothetical protein [Alphaproteobacteria bacterium]
MTDAPSASLFKRCEEGHIFDAAKADACPTCGSPAAGAGRPRPDAVKETGKEAVTPETAAGGMTAPPGVDERTSAAAEIRAKAAASPAGRRIAIAAGLIGTGLVLALATREPDRTGADPAGADTRSREVVAFDAPPAEEQREADERSAAAASEPYGLWEMYTPLPGQAPMRHVFEIREDGTYTIDAGPYSHAGRILFIGRTYQLKSQTSAYEDAGAFCRPDADTISFQGRLGASVWTRVKSPGLFDVDPDRHGAPINVAATLARMTAETHRTWREDATPVSLRIERSRHGTYDMKVSYISPKDQTGLVVTWGRFAASEFAVGGVSWFDRPLGAAFIDPGDAAAALGAVAPVKRAELGYFSRNGGGNTFDRVAPLAWLIVAEAGPSGLVAASAEADAAKARR